MALFVAGCTTTAADGPTDSSGSGSSTAVSPSVADVSSGPITSVVASSGLTTSPDPATGDAIDRAAIEAQWIEFWRVYRNILEYPEPTRANELARVAVEPTITKVLDAAKQAESDGVDNYGALVHHLSWPIPINGEDIAVVADCQDQSQAGTIKLATGEKLSSGDPKSNMRGEFVRGADSTWRLRQIYGLKDQPC